MPFEELPPKLKGGLPIPANKVAIHMRMTSPGRGGVSHKGLVVKIGSLVFKRLTWTLSESIRFLWGNGDETGQLQLTTVGNGTYKIRKNKHGTMYQVSTTVLPSSVADRLYRDELSVFTINASRLFIELPDGFYNSEAGKNGKIST
jgi:hypothetical protein